MQSTRPEKPVIGPGVVSLFGLALTASLFQVSDCPDKAVPELSAANPQPAYKTPYAKPGFCYLQRLRTDPANPTGDLVRGWERLNHPLMYRDNEGNLHTFHPGDEKQDNVFRHLAKAKGFTLVGRKERRAIWLEERRRYKRILAKRKAEEKNEMKGEA